MIDRTLAPKIETIERLDLLPPLHRKITEKVPLFWIQDGAGEAFKLDLQFNAGSVNTDKLVATFTFDLLLAGTATQNSQEINEAIDELGGFVGVEVTQEDATLSIFGLVEHFEGILSCVMTAVKDAQFPADELKQQIETKKKAFLTNQQKVSVLARRAFKLGLYGDTPYGRVTELSDYDTISQEKLRDFHLSNVLNGLQRVSLIGAVSHAQVDFLTQQVEGLCGTRFQGASEVFNAKTGRIAVAKPDAVQSAIRIGCLLFNRTHPDYIPFSILNTVLGGYFGSRLMTSIREEKGYTYGIGSGIAQTLDSGYFFISTEVGKDVTEDALEAIKAEMVRLQEEPISKAELELVKNYSTGQLLKAADGPFALMERYQTVERYGMTLNYYNEVLKALHTITPNRLQELAQQYLNWEEMLVVVAGGEG